MCARRFQKRQTGLEGKRVLVVEDEALVSMLIEDELLDAGAEVVGPAPRIEDALRLLERSEADGRIDAAVLDISLDGKHVSPVADRLAALGVPFVFATGYGAGCDTGGHEAAPKLEKPFDPAGLITVIEVLASPARKASAARAA